MNNAMQHLHARRRLYKYLEPFPAHTPFKRALDYLMYGVGIIAPLALVPQIMEIYVNKHAAGLSLYTWLLLTLFNSLWALYGAVHRARVILIANFLMAAFDLVIVVGILLYS